MGWVLKGAPIKKTLFKEMGATASDHGHASARTENLSHQEAEKLYKRILAKDFTSEEADQFRGQMLTEMAKMSCEDGPVMQIHPGSRRNHSNKIFGKFGLDKVLISRGARIMCLL